MARYIDADKLWNDRPQIPPNKSMDYGAGFSECMWGFSKRIKEQIDNPTTADVAPRAEVEKLYEVIFKKEDLMQKIAEERNKYADELEVAKDTNEHLKAEVAREIFEEIEKYMMDSVDVTHTAYKTIGTSTFAILKKKYTERSGK